MPRASFRDVTYSPDGRYIAACSGYFVPVVLLDAKDGSTIRIFQVPGETPKLSLEAVKVAFSADGSTIAASIDKDSEHFIQFWNVETGEPTWSLSAPEQIGVMAFSPDGRFFAAGDGIENLWFYQVEQDTLRLLWQDTEPGGMYRGMWFSQDGEHMLYTKNGVMKLRRTQDSVVLQRWYNVGGDCQATPDLQYFTAAVSGGWAFTFRIMQNPSTLCIHILH